MLTRREDGPLLAMIVSLIIGIFGGYGPSLSTIKSWHLEWAWRMCPGVSIGQPSTLRLAYITCLDLVFGGLFPRTYCATKVLV